MSHCLAEMLICTHKHVGYLGVTTVVTIDIKTRFKAFGVKMSVSLYQWHLRKGCNHVSRQSVSMSLGERRSGTLWMLVLEPCTDYCVLVPLPKSWNQVLMVWRSMSFRYDIITFAIIIISVRLFQWSFSSNNMAQTWLRYSVLPWTWRHVSSLPQPSIFWIGCGVSSSDRVYSDKDVAALVFDGSLTQGNCHAQDSCVVYWSGKWCWWVARTACHCHVYSAQRRNMPLCPNRHALVPKQTMMSHSSQYPMTQNLS